MSSLVLSRRAEADLIAVYLGTADKFGRRAADKCASELKVICSDLARSPKKGRTQRHLPAEIRKHDHALFGIFYRESEAGILVVRILGVAGRPELEKAWLEDNGAIDMTMSVSRVAH